MEKIRSHKTKLYFGQYLYRHLGGFLHGLFHVLSDLIVGFNEALQILRGVNQRKLGNVSSTNAQGTLVISHGLLATFLGGTNVNLVALESSNLFVDPGNDVGTVTDTNTLEEQTDAEQDVGEGVGQHGNGEGRSNKLPCDGGNDGGDKSTEESQVEEFLDSSRDSKDGFPVKVIGVGINVKGSDPGNEEHTRNDA